MYRVFQYKCRKRNGNSTTKIKNKIFFFPIFIFIMTGYLQTFQHLLGLVNFKFVFKGSYISLFAGLDPFLHRSDNLLYLVLLQAFSKFLFLLNESDAKRNAQNRVGYQLGSDGRMEFSILENDSSLPLFGEETVDTVNSSARHFSTGRVNKDDIH